MIAEKGFAAQEMGVIEVAVVLQPLSQAVGLVRPSLPQGFLTLPQSINGARAAIPPGADSCHRCQRDNQDQRSDQNAPESAHPFTPPVDRRPPVPPSTVSCLLSPVYSSHEILI